MDQALTKADKSFVTYTQESLDNRVLTPAFLLVHPTATGEASMTCARRGSNPHAMNIADDPRSSASTSSATGARDLENGLGSGVGPSLARHGVPAPAFAIRRLAGSLPCHSHPLPWLLDQRIGRLAEIPESVSIPGHRRHEVRSREQPGSDRCFIRRTTAAERSVCDNLGGVRIT